MRLGHIGSKSLSVLVAMLILASCGEAPSDGHTVDEPATVEEVVGSEFARITLTQQAIDRLGLTTASAAMDGALTVVPSGALFIDSDGGIWLYERLGPRSFGRRGITVDHEENDLAYLIDGPSAGTEVVDLGAAELYGIESGISH